jgi:dienelactone hydrolase
MTQSMIGAYGDWAAGLVGEGPASLSFRRPEWSDVEKWRPVARRRALECLAMPDTGGTPTATVVRTSIFDGLHVEELTWQLPYGPATEAILLKPADAVGPLPGVLAFHCHGGQKVFGKEKIAQPGPERHPVLADHHERYYGGVAWANQLAKRGYVVLIPDAFAFGSRRVRIADLPPSIRPDLRDDDRTPEGVAAYNQWAGGHESIMAKSLLCAGTTWAGVFIADDRAALDVLCARPDVDATRIGCGGLSGGGLRTVYQAGLDERIRCAVCVGMMTTWRDYLLNKSVNHTWMIYIPHLTPALDYPEILGLRAPRPTLVLNDIHDELFTLPEMERADRMLAEVYAKADASDRYRCSFYPGPHKFDLPMQAEAFDWFDRWLKDA